MWSRWRTIAFLCKYANQDVFRLLGRDPLKDPLTAVERSLFLDAITEFMEAEAAPPPNQGE